MTNLPQPEILQNLFMIMESRRPNDNSEEADKKLNDAKQKGRDKAEEMEEKKRKEKERLKVRSLKRWSLITIMLVS